MAADANGNDISAVGLPVTGHVAIAPYGTTLPTPVEGKDLSLTLDPAFEKLGLLTEDGGPVWEGDEGEKTGFWQEGYSIPTGGGDAVLTITLAQTDKRTQEFIRGIKFDENDHRVVDTSGNPNKYVVWVEEIFKNGAVRRRAGANVTVGTPKETQSKRGEIMAYEVPLTFTRDASHLGGQFHEWLIGSDPSADLVP